MFLISTWESILQKRSDFAILIFKKYSLNIFLEHMPIYFLWRISCLEHME